MDVTVGLRPGSSSVAKAESAGLKVASVADAVAGAVDERRDLAGAPAADVQHPGVAERHLAGVVRFAVDPGAEAGGQAQAFEGQVRGTRGRDLRAEGGDGGQERKTGHALRRHRILP